MGNSCFVISSNVINTINALPVEERLAITTALAAEMILGADPHGQLTPIQEVLYTMIRRYVTQDTRRACQTQQSLSASGFKASPTADALQSPWYR